jgi:hypothetical protein
MTQLPDEVRELRRWSYRLVDLADEAGPMCWECWAVLFWQIQDAAERVVRLSGDLATSLTNSAMENGLGGHERRTDREGGAA